MDKWCMIIIIFEINNILFHYVEKNKWPFFNYLYNNLTSFGTLASVMTTDLGWNGINMIIK